MTPRLIHIFRTCHQRRGVIPLVLWASSRRQLVDLCVVQTVVLTLMVGPRLIGSVSVVVSAFWYTDLRTPLPC